MTAHPINPQAPTAIANGRSCPIRPRLAEGRRPFHGGHFRALYIDGVAARPRPDVYRAVGIGIDFGTTRTVVAYADRGNYPVVSFESDEGDMVEWFPSVVAECNGELRFGFDALATASDPSFSQIRSFKRLLSGSDATASSTLTVGASRVSVRELVERFLGAFGDALRKRSNLPRSLRTSAELEAVVATPANAFCTQRFVTLEAFRRAGFVVRAMLNEPSAAGFEYSHRHARTLTSKREHVVVYDSSAAARSTRRSSASRGLTTTWS